jgi:flagellar motility protein MotE (MotC chaperone)|tara:strand:- start:4415 stop:4573 length:159 start_codon:yes stop_codon:yes gene_type:complete
MGKLKQGYSDSTRKKNTKKLIKSGYKPDQAAAIGHSMQRKNAAKRMMGRYSK